MSRAYKYNEINRILYQRNDDAVPDVVDRRRGRASDCRVARRDRQTTSRLSLEANRVRLAEQRHQEIIPGLQTGRQPAFGSGSGRRPAFHHGTEMETGSRRYSQLH